MPAKIPLEWVTSKLVLGRDALLRRKDSEILKEKAPKEMES